MTHSRIAIVTVAAALAICAMFIVGCGNNSSDTGASYAPTNSAPAPKVPAAGPAISDKLSFDQLALESTVKTVTSKDGLVFLEFQYADRDGKVYKCKLPKAMSQGQFAPDQWVRTFNVYKLPEVVKQMKAEKNDGESLSDLPLIAPKPQQQSATTSPMPQQ